MNLFAMKPKAPPPYPVKCLCVAVLDKGIRDLGAGHLGVSCAPLSTHLLVLFVTENALNRFHIFLFHSHYLLCVCVCLPQTWPRACEHRFELGSHCAAVNASTPRILSGAFPMQSGRLSFNCNSLWHKLTHQAAADCHKSWRQ